MGKKSKKSRCQSSANSSINIDTSFNNVQNTNNQTSTKKSLSPNSDSEKRDNAESSSQPAVSSVAPISANQNSRPTKLTDAEKEMLKTAFDNYDKYRSETKKKSSTAAAGEASNSSSGSKSLESVSIKNLMGSISKAANDRKKAAGSTKKDNELKEELSALLNQIKSNENIKNSPLASDKPLTAQEGLAELLQLLKSSKTSTVSQEPRSPSVDSSTVTESFLESTCGAGKITTESSSDLEGGKDESGQCQFCHKDASTKCTGCRRVFYCNRACQKSHWSSHKEGCRPYKVGKMEGFGRVLLATRDISPDEEIMREKPFVVGPRPSAEPVCLACYRRVSGNYRCSKCNWPLCGSGCMDSPHHSYECEASVASGVLGPEALTSQGYNHHNEIITAFRCLMAVHKDQERWRTLLDRFGNRHTLAQQNGIQFLHHQQEIIEPLKKVFRLNQMPALSQLEDSLIHTILNVLQVHSVPTRSTYGEVYGLYPMASLLGHSCVPNTRTRLHGDHLVIRSIEAIPSGAPLTAMFTDILWGTKARRDHLLQVKLFSCACRRCSDPTELGSYFSALTCPKCSPAQAILPTKPLQSSSPWECTSCRYQLNSEEVLQTTLSLGSEASSCLQNPGIGNLEALLEKWSPRVHTNHYHLHAVKHSLFQLYCRTKHNSEEEANKDQEYWKQMAKKEKICQEFLKVCSILDPSMAHSIPQFGLAFYELHQSVLQYAKKNFGIAKISTQQLKKKMQLARALLRRSMDILKNEAEDTPEGELHERCEEEFIAVGKWMLAVGLV